MGVRSGVERFSIGFDRWYGSLSSLLGLPPSSAYVEVDATNVEVRMGWAFRARVPRSTVVTAGPVDIRPLSRGVHGFAGRWLVNGSGRGIVRIALNPAQRAHVIGLPVGARELLVSVTEPSALVDALRAG